MKVDFIDSGIWVKDLKRLLEAYANMPMTETTPEEKAAFMQKYWHASYGPPLGRIGNFVIYHDDR